VDVPALGAPPVAIYLVRYRGTPLLEHFVSVFPPPCRRSRH
jgi:hypothetical protein